MGRRSAASGERLAGRQGPVTGRFPARLLTVAPLSTRAVAHPGHALTRSCGERATPWPANRHEAGGAPAIEIEARKGRGPAPPGLGAKHESPGPKSIAPKRNRRNRPGATARLGAKADVDELQRNGPVAVRAPLHTPELRRSLDRAHVPAALAVPIPR